MSPALRVRIVLLVMLLVGVAAERFIAIRSASQVYAANLGAIPLGVGDIAGVEDQLDDEIADILQATQTLNRRYEQDGQPYLLFVG